MPRQVNQAAIDLVKSFEGCRLRAYQDQVGVWTIGYGHTDSVLPGMNVPKVQADIWLKQDLEKAGNGVSSLVSVDLTDNQFGALVSFAFNLGIGALGKSTLLKLLNSGDYDGAAGQFERWDMAGGQVSLGLQRRRQEERVLFEAK